MGSAMNSKNSSQTSGVLGERIRTCLAALVVSLAAAGSAPAAVSFPPYPLLTGGDSIPPNILLILDDSGSMAFEVMPDDACEYSDQGCRVNNKWVTGKWTTSNVNVARYTYARNTIFYNPAVTYQPWLKADGKTRMTGGTSYSAAYGSFNLVGGTTIDLGNASSCARFNNNDGNSNNNTAYSDEYSSGTEVCGGEQVFFVPKNRADTSNSYLSNGLNYRFYKILAGGADIVSTTTYGKVVTSTANAAGFPKTGQTANRGAWVSFPIQVPANATSLDVGASSGWNNGNGDLYVSFGSQPTTSSYVCRSRNSDNNESCPISNPAAGTYYIGFYASSKFTNVTLSATVTTTNRCGTGTGSNDWINCASALPGTRSVAEELTNYATWFSYYRTRNKMAKGGASEAFGGLEKNYRIGFDTIWNRGGSGGSVGGNSPSFPIPTSRNNGLFEDKTGSENRTDFFDRLQGVVAFNGTPLHGSLQRAGRYFSRTDDANPWRDGSGNELSCRQNYALLATDGYWNNATSGGGYTTEVGNADSGTKYPDSYNNTLADVAAYYWKTDLRTDKNMPNNVRPTSLDEATWQHMVTFGISIGAQGTLDPTQPAPASWPNPTLTEDARRIDDLWHASLNGRGAFVVASDTEKFAAALKSALQSIDARTASGSNIASSSTKTESSTLTFVAGFTSVSWIGDLKASPFNAALTGVSDTALWQLSQTFTASGVNATSFASRPVLTSMGGRAALFNDSLPSSSVFARTSGADAVSAADNIAYLRGDQSKEKSKKDGTLRSRTYPIGDIVDSSPAYVDDTRSVFVGANDGMLHAIDATNGKVLFSYVPKGLDFESMASLSSPSYEHRYFVDGQMDVISRANQGNGKNILVAALGRGGRGVFALDVTNPASVGTANVLWDDTFQTPLTGTDPDADMGYVLGAVRIRKGNEGKTYALVPNGIDSPNGSAALYAYELSATGSVVKMHKLVAATGPDNGLMSTGMADLNGDGKIDVVYGGDLKGNIWRWDFTGINPGAAVKIFQATDGANKPQPITGGLAVGRDTSGRLFVGFGTGRFIANGDVPSADAKPQVQSIYGIIDSNTTISGRSDLQARTIPYSGKTAKGEDARGFESYSMLATDKKGWYIDLPTPERVTSAPTIYGSGMYLASQIPATGADCSGATGSGFVNALNLFTGTSAKSGGYFTDQTGLTGKDGSTGSIGSIGVVGGMPTEVNITSALATWGTGGGLDTGSGGINPPTGGRPSRISWREIIPE